MTTNPHYYKRAISVFSTHRETEDALRELKNAGFDMDRVSVIVRDSERGDRIADVEVHEKPVGNKAEEGAAAGAVTGGALGTITGFLVGLGTLAIPGIGPILLAGAEATALATTLAGTAIGAATGGIIGALIGLGIPEERAKVYSDRVSRGDYLVMLNGTETEILRAEGILASQGIQEWGVYDAPDLNTTADVSSTQPTQPINSATATGDPEVVIIDRRN